MKEPDKTASESNRSNWSLTRRDARHQMGVAIALITVIPLLALFYLLFVVDADSGPLGHAKLLIAGFVLLSIVFGYSIVSRYPMNIMRLRRYLHDMVNGRLPEKVVLLNNMEDIPAIEQSLNMLIGQLSRQVERMEGELQRIEWLLKRTATPAFTSKSHARRTHGRQGATSGEPQGLIMRMVGEDTLVAILGDIMDLLETSAVVYDEDARVALDVTVSDWCKFMMQAHAQGDGATCCPTEAAQTCLKTTEPVDVPCECGLSCYCAPVIAGKGTVGVVAFTYGDPPRSHERLRPIAGKLGVTIEDLQTRASRYETRPEFIVSVAKNRLLTVARLVGEMIERRQAEQIVRKSEEELRRHRDHLEDIVKERTAELKSANDQLKREIGERRKAQRLKDEFVSTVSHELRTPLAITKEGISLMIDGIPGTINERQRDVLGKAAGNVDRLARIINDLLDISKIEAGRMEINKERMDLAELARDACTEFRSMARQKGLELSLNVSETPLDVYADSERLRQVLNNLIGNAIKFTTEGQIAVEAGMSDGSVSCTVRDTGSGIPPEDLPKLFNKFVQLKRKHGAGERGTGLGLAIAKNILELHGGTIRAESEEGVGSQFVFTLPCYSEDLVLTSRVEQRVAEARHAQSSFTLFLYQFSYPTTVPADVSEHAFLKGTAAVVEGDSLFRKSDEFFPGSHGRIAVLASMDKTYVPRLAERWKAQIGERFRASEPDMPFELRCGTAHYPESATSAKDLIGCASEASDADDAPTVNG